MRPVEDCQDKPLTPPEQRMCPHMGCAQRLGHAGSHGPDHLRGCSVTEPIGICTCGLFLALSVDGGSDTMTAAQDKHWQRLSIINRVYATVIPMNRTKPNLESLWCEEKPCVKS